MKVRAVNVRSGILVAVLGVTSCHVVSGLDDVGAIAGDHQADETSAGGAGGDCSSVDISLEPHPPVIHILLDKSGSMGVDFNGQTRWSAVYDALLNPNDGVITLLQDQVKFGITMYNNESSTCPALVTVAPALSNHAAIERMYALQMPISNGPTGDAVAVITPTVVDFASNGSRLLLLATDGDPDRCDAPGAHDAVSKQNVIDAVSTAFAQGVQTVLIAVGDDVSDDHQQDVANAGKGLAAPTTYPCIDPNLCAPTYEPATKSELISALTAIVEAQHSCVFQLGVEISEGRECDATITVNNLIIPCNDPNGWRLTDNGEVEFLGTTCSAIIADPSAIIDTTFPCDAVL